MRDRHEGILGVLGEGGGALDLADAVDQPLAVHLQHAGYIAHWLEALRHDKRLVFTAASMAQKAADFVLSTSEVAPCPQAMAMAA